MMSEVIKHNARLWERRGETKSYFLFWCPGCGCGHVFQCGDGFAHPQRWEFDGNYDNPSFSPSLRMFTRVTREEGDRLVDTGEQQTTCHLHVQAGELRYCGDCPHAMNGKTIPMQDIPNDYGF